MSDNVKQLLAILSGYPILWWLFNTHPYGRWWVQWFRRNCLSGFYAPLYMFSLPLLFIPCVIAVFVFGTYGMRTYWIVVSVAVLLISLLITAGRCNSYRYDGVSRFVQRNDPDHCPILNPWYPSRGILFENNWYQQLILVKYEG